MESARRAGCWHWAVGARPLIRRVLFTLARLTEFLNETHTHTHAQTLGHTCIDTQAGTGSQAQTTDYFHSTIFLCVPCSGVHTRST